MNLTLLKTVLIFASYFHSIAGKGKKCIGDNAAIMPDGCVIFEAKKIVFTETDNVEMIKEKMKTVRIIEHGVEVIGTSLENFDYLSQVREIYNLEGPALMFKDNKKLKRISMEGSKILKGKEVDVVFDKDNFPSATYEDTFALNELLHLEAAARDIHDREKCTADFIEIVPADPAEHGWLLYFLIALCVVGIGLLGLQVYLLFKTKKKNARNGEKKGKKEKGEKTPSTERKEETPSAEKNSGKGSEGEDPKKK